MRCQTNKVCKECREFNLNCTDGKKCKDVRQKLRDYNGIRFTADGFDCALPVTIDSHSSCAYECLYCFSDNLIGHSYGDITIGQTRLQKIENIFAGRGGYDAALVREALKYNKRNKGGYPCAVQLGGLCDAGDSIEQNQGWLLDFIDLAIKYNQPVRMSTKSAIFQLPEYFEKIKKAPHLFWVAFSIITDDDGLLRKIDRYAPTATQRLETMQKLSRIGVSTSLRLRPIMYKITDRNKAYQSLIIKAAKAGAKAISYEVGFYPQRIPTENKWKWALLEKIANIEYKKIYSAFGRIQACTRPSYLWTENIMHSIKEIAKQNGLTVGVSDPVWKQLTETGCCCGILESDPVFGNWEKENATNLMYIAKQRKELIYLKDCIPSWAYKQKCSKMVNMGAGPKVALNKKYLVWADKLTEIWNTPTAQRSPMNYFQGAWQIHKENGINKLDADGNLIYEYVGLDRKYKKTGWNV